MIKLYWLGAKLELNRYVFNKLNSFNFYQLIPQNTFA